MWSLKPWMKISLALGGPAGCGLRRLAGSLVERKERRGDVRARIWCRGLWNLFGGILRFLSPFRGYTVRKR